MAGCRKSLVYAIIFNFDLVFKCHRRKTEKIAHNAAKNTNIPVAVLHFNYLYNIRLIKPQKRGRI